MSYLTDSIGGLAETCRSVALRGAKLSASAILCAGLGLAAPAMAQEDAQDVNDPLEEVNRVFFDIHNGLDKLIIAPIARAYVYVVPEPGRQGVTNFLRNLNSPVVFANDVLQGEPNRAGTTLARFAVNSTIGIGGIFDPATGMGLERHHEDFGQTLGVYGVSEGPYLFLPLFGPSPPRDLVGRAVDTAMDPVTWIGGEDFQYFKYGRTALRVIDLRARNLETLDEIERTSIDYYAAVRSLYRQSREGAIRNGEFDFEELPDLSEDFEEDF